MKILGIDPGSRLTGFGCVEIKGRDCKVVTHGTLFLEDVDDARMEMRLLRLFNGLIALIEKTAPQAMVVERIFFAKNAASALKLGQARGIILLAGARAGIPVAEYAPTEVKQALGGGGRADKVTLARMITLLTGEKNFQTWDASDALALALCHAFQIRSGANAGGRSAKRKSISLGNALRHKIQSP